MAVLLAKRALPRTLDAPPAEVSEQLAQLPIGFCQQALDGPAVSLNLKKLAKPPGAWRLRTGDWRSIFFHTGEDFLVVAIGLRKDIYERADRMRLARRGDGLTVIEAPPAPVDDSRARSPAGTTQRAHRRPAAQQNGFSPFDDTMLRHIEGVDQETLDFLRSLPAAVDAPTVLGDRLENVDLAFLLADLWERQEHYLATFAAGGAPSVGGQEIEEAELQTRLQATSSATELVEVSTSAQIRKLLDGSIEQWMVYLHPSQRAIANATFNGPARVRGGPGTGKTVVALHRARVLARRRVQAPNKILLTTFLSTLPKVWTSLMELLDARALERLDVRNMDVLARDLVATANGGVLTIASGTDRQKLVEPLLKRHGLEQAMAGNTQLLLVVLW